MAVVRASAVPVLEVVLYLIDENNTVTEKRVREGDLLRGIQYVENGVVKTETGILKVINFTTTPVSTVADPCVHDNTSIVTRHIKVASLLLDCSDQFNCNMITIPVGRIRGLSAIDVVVPPAASVDGVEYATFAEALAAAPDGAEVVLAQDLVLEENMEFNKALTLDLGAHAMSGASVVLTDGANVTIKNGTFSAPAGNSGVYVKTGGKLTVAEDAVVEGTWGVSISKSGETAAENFSSGKGVELVINGTLRGLPNANGQGGCGLAINGMIADATEGNYPVVTIGPNAVIEGIRGPIYDTDKNGGAGAGIYSSGHTKLIFKEGCKVSGDDAIVIRRGIIEVEGGTFVANGEYINPHTSQGNVTETGGAVFSIPMSDQTQSVQVSIAGGTFTSANGPVVYDGQKLGAAKPSAIDDIAVSGGMFNSGATAAVFDSNDTVNGFSKKEFITGGTYNKNLDITLCKSNYAPTDNGNGTYTVSAI